MQSAQRQVSLFADDTKAEVSVRHGDQIFTGPRDLIAKHIADLKKQKQRDQKRDEVFPGSDREKMTALCMKFPSLRGAKGVKPWDATRFALWVVSDGHASGVIHSARFVLNVWNSRSDWPRTLREESVQQEPIDRPLWEGLQVLLREARKALEADARYGAKEHGETYRAPTQEQIRERVWGYFDALKPFNLCDAMATWDDAHREAFVLWAKNPFFP
jgi:hypothetical protein